MLRLRHFDFELPPFLKAYAAQLKQKTPEALLMEGCRVVVVKTEYYLPDYPDLLGPPLTFQTVDDVDLLPRVLSYVDYCRANLETKLSSVMVDIGNAVPDARLAQYFGRLN